MNNNFWFHLYQYRRYIWKNAWNDLRYRYVGTGLGIFWNVAHPLVEIVIYTVVFSLLFSNRSSGMSYRLYIIVGILTWGVFTNTIQRGSNAILEHARYLKQLDFPVEIFVAKVALTFLLILHIDYCLFIPVSVFLGNRIGWKIFLLPVFLLLLQGLALGMSLTLAHLRVFLPDIKELIQALIPLWRWTLPVIYPETILPESVRQWLFLNPPYIFFRSIRRLVLEAELPELYDWTIMLLWLLFMLGFGIFVNQKLQYEVKEIL